MAVMESRPDIAVPVTQVVRAGGGYSPEEAPHVEGVQVFV